MKAEKDYLESVLRAAGYKGHIFTSMKELSTSNESYIAAILRDGEVFTISGSKRKYEDQSGARMKRTKLFDRQTRLKVVIGDTTEARCEETLVSFLTRMGKGTAVDRNWVDIEMGDADWVEDKDSILKAKMAVEFPVTFRGGIYQDTDLSTGTIGSIEMGNRKE